MQKDLSKWVDIKNMGIEQRFVKKIKNFRLEVQNNINNGIKGGS